MWPFKKKATAAQLNLVLDKLDVLADRLCDVKAGDNCNYEALAERLDFLSNATRTRDEHALDFMAELVGSSTKTMTQHMGQLQQATSTQGVAIANINENLVRIVAQMRDIKQLEKQVADLELVQENLQAEVVLAAKHAANLERERDKLQATISDLQSDVHNYDIQYEALLQEKVELAEQLGNSESDAKANLQIMQSLREAVAHYKEAATQLMGERDDLKTQLQKHIMASVVQPPQAGQVANQQVSPPPPVELSASTQSFLQGLAADLHRALQSNAVGANLQQPKPAAPIGGLDSAAVYNVTSSTEDEAAKQYAASMQDPAFGKAQVESALRSLANPIQFTPTSPEIVGTATEGTGQVEIGTSAGFVAATSRPVLLPSQQQYLLESGISLQP